MPLKLNSLEVFIAIVDAGSISRAAENLDMPKSGVSRHLSDLEKTLDARLLERTTRRIALTEAGQTVYDGAQRIVGNVEALQAEIIEDKSRLTGRLSVFAPVALISELLNPHLGEFSRQYPALELEFLSGAARPDLLHDKLDLIIHPDAPEDSSFVGVKLMRIQKDYFASPGYVDQHGQPEHPNGLDGHHCIVELDHNRRNRPWLFRDNGTVREARTEPHCYSDSSAAVRALAEQGLGIAYLPRFYGQQAVAKGRLVALFSGEHQVAHDVYGIYSSRKMKPRKLELFLEFLTQALPEEI